MPSQLRKNSFWVFAIVFSVGVHLVLFWPKEKATPKKAIAANFEILPPLAQPKPSPCPNEYLDLYEGSDLNIRIVFGYKDSRPARFVGDRYEAGILIHYLTSPCPENFSVCGFLRDPDDAEHFTKKIKGPRGNEVTLHLFVVTSSYGPDDEENRKANLQAWQSEHALKAYLDGIRAGDVVFYNGHSRDGGGPDFSPPQLSSGSVDYAWYTRRREGFGRLLSALKESTRKPKLLGLFSCQSGPHFSEQLRTSSNRTALITSRNLLYYTDAMKNILGALTGILNFSCKKEMALQLQAETPRLESKLENFFD